MKSFFSCLSLLLVTAVVFAQTSTAKEIEPGQKTSFDNYGLLIVAIIGLLVLIGLGIWFKRTRKM